MITWKPNQRPDLSGAWWYYTYFCFFLSQKSWTFCGVECIYLFLLGIAKWPITFRGILCLEQTLVLSIIQFRSLHSSIDFHSVQWKEWSIRNWSYATHHLLNYEKCSHSNLEALYTLVLMWLQPLTAQVLSPLWALSPSPQGRFFPKFGLLAKQSTWRTHLSPQLQWSFLCMSHFPISHFQKCF